MNGKQRREMLDRICPCGECPIAWNEWSPECREQEGLTVVRREGLEGARRALEVAADTSDRFTVSYVISSAKHALRGLELAKSSSGGEGDALAGIENPRAFIMAARNAAVACVKADKDGGVSHADFASIAWEKLRELARLAGER